MVKFNQMVVVILLVAAAMVGGIYAASNAGLFAATSVQVDPDTGEPLPAPAGCGDDGQCTVELSVQNILNESGIETYDAEITFRKVDGSGEVTGTTSTADDYVLSPGQWELVVESADGASGDNSKIAKMLKAPKGAKLTSDGTIVFTPQSDSDVLRAGVPQHATLEFRAYDNEDGRFAFDSGDAEATSFEADGVTFRDGDNATAFALSADGNFIDHRYEIRAVQTDTEFCDNYCLIGVEAPVTEYDEPTVDLGGVLDNIKGSGLNANEAKQLANYEYVYKYTGTIDHKIKKLNFYIEANSDASTDLQIDFLAAGKVDSLNGVDILTTAAQDDSSASVVYTVMDITTDIS